MLDLFIQTHNTHTHTQTHTRIKPYIDFFIQIEFLVHRISTESESGWAGFGPNINIMQIGFCFKLNSGRSTKGTYKLFIIHFGMLLEQRFDAMPLRYGPGEEMTISDYYSC